MLQSWRGAEETVRFVECPYSIDHALDAAGTARAKPCAPWRERRPRVGTRGRDKSRGGDRWCEHRPAWGCSPGSGRPPRCEVVDHTGSKRRAASPEEAAGLPHRKVVAPVRLERALRARLGLEPWLDAYETVRFDARQTMTDDVFG